MSAMSPPNTPSQNHLLAALPAAEFARLSPHLELVPLRLGDTLYEPGTQLQHVYFPTTSVVSLLMAAHWTPMMFPGLLALVLTVFLGWKIMG